MRQSLRLIARQLRKSGLEPNASPEVKAFVDLVAESYNEFEKHRKLTEHSTRLASEELEESIKSLGASERLFRSLARCSPNGIIHTDGEGQCLYANERVQQLVGRSADELAGLGWLECLPADDRKLFYELSANAEIDSEIDSEIDMEHRVILNSGEIIWVSTVIAALRDANEEAVGWVANIEDITERRRYERELSLLARHDSLTQLLNRHAFRQRLDELFAARTSSSRLAIALVDLDRFKLVNDTFGHEVGDYLLIAVADILRASSGEHDLAGRLGGDEFAIATLLDEDTTPMDLGASLSEALHRLVDVGSQSIQLAASVGVAVVEGKRGTPTTLLREADIAMYRAKGCAIHRYEVFDESHHGEGDPPQGR